MSQVYTRENWEGLMKAMNGGERCQITEDIFDYFLDILPPKFMNRRVELVNGEQVYASFGFAEGAMQVIAFWRKTVVDGQRQYFAQQSKVWSNGY